MRPEPVASADDPRLAPFRDLHRTRPDGLVVAEGALAVRRLLAGARFTVRAVLATPDALAALGDALDGTAAPVHVAPRPVIAQVAGYPFHRGCVALGELRVPVDLEAVLGATLLVGLERVRDRDNVGAVVRTAHAFGADAVLLSPGCADPWAPKAVRVSMGAAFELPLVQVDDWPAALARLAAAGLTLVALTPQGDTDVAALAAAPARALLLCGSEHEGLAPATRAAARLAVRIPLAPDVDSLNVGTAAGIALHHLARGRVAMRSPGR